MGATQQKHIVIVGGGTSGSVLASRLSEDPRFAVTLLEAGPDESAYNASVKEPSRAPEAWLGLCPIERTVMHTEQNPIPILQGRMLGGTSATNGLATLRGLPEDYDGWAADGLEGWGWEDVVETFKSVETDGDFPTSPLHGDSGPLTVRRWRRDEMSHAQVAFYEGMVETGNAVAGDINDPSQLPGIGVFPVTIDGENQRLTTSLAFLSSAVRDRDNLTIRTGSPVATIAIDGDHACGVTLQSGETIEADEVILSAGALFTPVILMRSGIGPAAHLQDHDIVAKADLPVGETLHDHLGPGVPYRHEGPRGGTAGPAQSLYIGASNGRDVDYHLFPIAPPPGDGPTDFNMAAFLLRSSGKGSVRLGDTPEADPIVTAPPLPNDGVERLRHAFQKLAAWEGSEAFKQSGCVPLVPSDLSRPDAAKVALERGLMSYGHMTSSCPMGKVLDADCRVLGIGGLRVVDASVMPTIPSGNTYLGCVMIAERVASKIKVNPN